MVCAILAGGHAFAQLPTGSSSPSGWLDGFSSAANASVEAALTTEPARPRAGKATTLHFSITDGGAPVEDLTVHHGRKLHVVLISEDMQVFGHIHPEDFDEPIANGEASVRFTFPRAGRYLAAADLATAAGTHAEHYTVDVEGDPDVATSAGREASVAVVRTEDEDSYTAPVILDTPRTTEGYELSLARPRTISAGTPATFVWRLIKDGEPVTDLQLYLAAPMHIAMVKEDLSHFVHGHGTARGLGTGYDHAHGAERRRTARHNLAQRLDNLDQRSSRPSPFRIPVDTICSVRPLTARTF